MPASSYDNALATELDEQIDAELADEQPVLLCARCPSTNVRPFSVPYCLDCLNAYLRRFDYWDDADEKEEP